MICVWFNSHSEIQFALYFFCNRVAFLARNFLNSPSSWAAFLNLNIVAVVMTKLKAGAWPVCMLLSRTVWLALKIYLLAWIEVQMLNLISVAAGQLSTVPDNA